MISSTSAIGSARNLSSSLDEPAPSAVVEPANMQRVSVIKIVLPIGVNFRIGAS